MHQEEIVALLRKDMMGEHQAIIQYLSHAYALGEGEFAGEIEAIAREEMRHLDWLADAIVELGGDPSMDRDPVDFSSGAAGALLGKNVDLEQVAIDQYRAHIEMIDDPGIRRLLARIAHDEVVHKRKFQDLVEEMVADGEADQFLMIGHPEGPSAEEGGSEPAPPERLADILNEGIRHEYTVTLQYLFHSFVTDEKELAEELQTTAINEMQHMGWLSEALRSKGGIPEMEHMGLFLSHDAEKNLEADIAIEREVTQAYTSQVSELDDPGLRDLVERIRDHEIYHDAIFTDLLEEVETEENPAEQIEEQPNEDKATEEPKAEEPPPIPSVGSLLGGK